MTANAQGEITSCNGGSDGKIKLVISGASGQVNVVWSNPAWNGLTTINNAPAGNYSVTVTDQQNCVVTDNVIIGQPDPVMFSCSGGSNTAHGAEDGAATITVVGGTPNYSISWNGPETGTLDNRPSGTSNLTALKPGNYGVTVTDNNGCTSTCTFVILDQACTVSLTLKTRDASCFGECDGEAELTLNGFSGLPVIDWGKTEYAGLSKITGLCSGNYKVTVTDTKGCSATLGSIFVDQPEQIILELTADNEVVKINESFGLHLDVTSSGTAISDIQWDNSANLSCDDCYDPIARISDPTVFNVTVRDSAGCEAKTSIEIKILKVRQIEFPNIINTSSTSGNAVFYPKGNADEVVMVEQLRIYDRWGNLVFENSEFEINAPEEGWDGHFRGVLVNPAVFLYYSRVLMEDGSAKIYNGDLTVIR
jgi:hypothetical protein